MHEEWLERLEIVRREDRKDLVIAKDMTRREFLRTGIGLAAAATSLEIITGCAAPEVPKDRIIHTEQMSDYKIVPPQDGCLVGFYKDQHKRFQIGREISTTIDHYRNALGAYPATLAFWTFLSLGFPMTEAETMSEQGIVPYINIMPGHEKWELSFGPDDVANGKSDRYIKKLAMDAVRFGKQHGNFFFTTMVEFNASWWPWSLKPGMIPAWRRMWQIFEDLGANQYATWVWEAFCPARYGTLVTDPEPYYPGDKYVDWIGMNVFANFKNKYISENTMFGELLSPTYERMTTDHPQKPIMVSEFGRTPGDSQPQWLIDAFRSMKDEFTKVKAAIYYDNITNVHGGQDHTLDQKSLSTLKEIFKDPYWIMAK
jgi:hypothetical protein